MTNLALFLESAAWISQKENRIFHHILKSLEVLEVMSKANPERWYSDLWCRFRDSKYIAIHVSRQKCQTSFCVAVFFLISRINEQYQRKMVIIVLFSPWEKARRLYPNNTLAIILNIFRIEDCLLYYKYNFDWIVKYRRWLFNKIGSR